MFCSGINIFGSTYLFWGKINILNLINDSFLCNILFDCSHTGRTVLIGAFNFQVGEIAHCLGQWGTVFLAGMPQISPVFFLGATRFPFLCRICCSVTLISSAFYFLRYAASLICYSAFCWCAAFSVTDLTCQTDMLLVSLKNIES